MGTRLVPSCSSHIDSCFPPPHLCSRRAPSWEDPSAQSPYLLLPWAAPAHTVVVGQCASSVSQQPHFLLALLCHCHRAGRHLFSYLCPRAWAWAGFSVQPLHPGWVKRLAPIQLHSRDTDSAIVSGGDRDPIPPLLSMLQDIVTAPPSFSTTRPMCASCRWLQQAGPSPLPSFQQRGHVGKKKKSPFPTPCPGPASEHHREMAFASLWAGVQLSGSALV